MSLVLESNTGVHIPLFLAWFVKDLSHKSHLSFLLATAFGLGLNRLRMLRRSWFSTELNFAVQMSLLHGPLILGKLSLNSLDMVSLFVQRRITFTLLRVAFVICLVVLVFTNDQFLLQLFSVFVGGRD